MATRFTNIMWLCQFSTMRTFYQNRYSQILMCTALLLNFFCCFTLWYCHDVHLLQYDTIHTYYLLSLSVSYSCCNLASRGSICSLCSLLKDSSSYSSHALALCKPFSFENTRYGICIILFSLMYGVM